MKTAVTRGIGTKANRVRLADGMHARTDGTDIWFDDRLSDIQRKCAIVHELIHIERGQGSRQLESEEFAVRYQTARRLLPIGAMVGVCSVQGSLSAAAKDLGVIKRVLMDRAAVLSEADAVAAGCRSCMKCPAMAARYDAVQPPSADRWQEQVEWRADC